MELEPRGCVGLVIYLVCRLMRKSDVRRRCGSCLVPLRGPGPVSPDRCSGITTAGNARLGLVHSVPHAAGTLLANHRASFTRF